MIELLVVIAIIALLIAHMILFLIKTTDEIPGYWRLIPFLVIPISYTLMRSLFIFFESELENSVSLLVMIVSTALVVIILLKFRTNTFKTRTDMKSLKKNAEE